VNFNPPAFPVICNVDACRVSEPDQIRQSLQDQVTGTVCWTETQELLVDEEKCDLFMSSAQEASLPACSTAREKARFA
jgi:[acyl-carrier-protein] S-malonyltransferase